jgi:hypothetical protein
MEGETKMSISDFLLRQRRNIEAMMAQYEGAIEQLNEQVAALTRTGEAMAASIPVVAPVDLPNATEPAIIAEEIT